MKKLGKMKQGFRDAFGKTWHSSEVEAYNRKVDTYNYTLEHQPNLSYKAREEVSNAFHSYCGGSVRVGG